MEKSVLITGGSRGIGAAAVRVFTRAGYRTAFFYKENRQAAESVSRQTGAQAIVCDVSDPSQIRAGVKAAKVCLGVSGFDTLIANAAISRTGLFTEMTDEQWQEMLSVNLSGCVLTAREVLPDMIGRKHGQVITISSMWGQTGASCEVAYSATKAAVIGFTKALAKEVGLSGIRVNCIAPGVIDTDMNSSYDRTVMEELAEETAVGRIGTAEEVAETALFLASDKASYITGQVIGVNGGFYL